MDTKMTEQMTEMTKNVLDSMLKLQAINDRTVQSLAKQQLEVAENYMTNGVKQLKIMSEAKDAQSAMSSQAELASELGNMMMNQAKQAMEVMNQSRTELNSLIEGNMAKFMDMTTPKK